MLLNYIIVGKISPKLKLGGALKFESQSAGIVKSGNDQFEADFILSVIKSYLSIPINFP